jgi:hypothetical protein
VGYEVGEAEVLRVLDEVGGLPAGHSSPRGS